MRFLKSLQSTPASRRMISLGSSLGLVLAFISCAPGLDSLLNIKTQSGVSISSPQAFGYVNLLSSTALVISGSCNQNGSLVTVTLSDDTLTLTPLTSVTCRTGSSPNWSTTMNVSALADGTLTLKANKKGAEDSDGVSLILTKDIIPPDFPTISLPDLAPTLSSEARPVFDVSGLEEGGLLSLYQSSDCSGSVNSTVVPLSESTTITASALTLDETYSFSAQYSDRAGNPSLCSNSVSYSLDRTVDTPTLSLVGDSSPSGNPSPQVLVSGIETGSTVKLYRNPNCTNLEATHLVTSSTFTFTVNPLPSSGTYGFSAQQLDTAGNLSNCSSALIYILN